MGIVECVAIGSGIGGIFIVRNISEYKRMRYKLLPSLEERNGLEKAIEIAEETIEETCDTPLFLKLLGEYGARKGAEHYLDDVRA